jgi:LysM repeat protein
MGDHRSTPSSARKRYFKRRLRRMGLLLTAALVMAVVVCGSLAYPVIAPDSSLGASIAETQTPLIETPEAVVRGTQAAFSPTATSEQLPTKTLPTQGQIVPPSDDANILYYTVAGDSLLNVSLRFGVDVPEITSPQPIEREGLIPPGQLLIIPNKLNETSSSKILLPDSEVTYSPSTIDFDVHGFVKNAGGYLSTYSEYLSSTDWTSGADIISRIALEYSINPRLLLAFLEYKSGWVFGNPADAELDDYPLDYVNSMKKGLYLQCAWFASTTMDGYYGWREGRRLAVTFQDDQVLRLAPELNAGTVGLMNVFTYLYDFEGWAHTLYGEDGFIDFYENMFPNPWIRSQSVEPLIPADTVQPEMILPFEVGKVWAFTGGPHAAWSKADVWAALDFAPASDVTGCYESDDWVVASMSGLIVRSGNGVVVIDRDGDGYEQTGWTLLYMHIADKDRVELGIWVEMGDRIGHPSCEGGRSTGTHVHMARRYNGEWVPADGPLPFTLSGWVAKRWNNAYEGWLIRGEDKIFANTSATYDTQITRDE